VRSDEDDEEEEGMMERLAANRKRYNSLGKAASKPMNLSARRLLSDGGELSPEKGIFADVEMVSAHVDEEDENGGKAPSKLSMALSGLKDGPKKIKLKLGLGGTADAPAEGSSSSPTPVNGAEGPS